LESKKRFSYFYATTKEKEKTVHSDRKTPIEMTHSNALLRIIFRACPMAVNQHEKHNGV
jgi:hypothetical protein